MQIAEVRFQVLYVCQWPIIHFSIRIVSEMFIRHATGKPVVLGKPAQLFFEAAPSMIGCHAGESAMIGDDVQGDVGGAQAAGILGLLVRTGIFQSASGSDQADGSS